MTFFLSRPPVPRILGAILLAWACFCPWGVALSADPPPAAHPHRHVPAAENTSAEAGLVERLGNKIPLDLRFRDEQGKSVALRDLITGPTIIAPVYYQCPDVCSFLQGELTRVLPKLKLKPAEQYRVLSVSFDETETPRLAADNKRNYFAAMGNDYPQDAWRFLTGDRQEILQLTDAAGYHFQRQGRDFIHPVVIFVVAGDGTIVRYLSGTSFLPMDLSLALIEASQGRIGATIRKVATFCFSFDPLKKTYVFNLLRVAATVTIVTAGAFMAFLIISGRKRRQR
ncbi:MAG: cytochrome-c oxidase [Desulfuromonadaceae bacterium GWC2_58_13]|nr:MAG: cytochrome-c oxidase [Desulfuromonadaceae bacterium GWC2_58_13]